MHSYLYTRPNFDFASLEKDTGDTFEVFDANKD